MHSLQDCQKKNPLTICKNALPNDRNYQTLNNIKNETIVFQIIIFY